MAIILLGYLQMILTIAMYFSLIIFAIKGSQAFNIYINKNK